MTHSAAKGFRLLLAVGVLSGTSCDRVRLLPFSFGKGKSGGTPAAVRGPLITEVIAADVDGFSKKGNRLVIVYYYATWNGPCRQLDPYFETITKKYGGAVIVGRVDTEQFPKFAMKMDVKDVPDVRMFRDGRAVDGFVGLPDDDVMDKMIAKHAHDLKPPTGPEPEKAPPQAITAPMPKDWMPPGVRRR